MSEVHVEVRYSAQAAPLVVCEQVYYEAEDVILHSFENRSIECIIEEKDIPKLRKLKGVLDVDVVA